LRQSHNGTRNPDRNPASRRVPFLTFFTILVLAAGDGCGAGPASPPPDARVSVATVGHLGDDALDEASGIAASRRTPGVFWLIDDDGPPRLYAIDATGAGIGHVDIEGARNVNWEDIAAFTLDGAAWLLVSDIGDNASVRKHVTAYVVAEPAPDARSVPIAWAFDFSYPDGPADAEAMAVDAAARRVLVLTKRQIPAILHALPLRPAADTPLVATRLGAVDTLPQPGRSDILSAPVNLWWWWQPTAMDISADGRAAVILTYHGVYYYPRTALDDWAAVFARQPIVLDAGDYNDAESVAFGPDGASVFVTFEGRHARLLRIELDGVSTP
jgi:hypothetical protein